MKKQHKKVKKSAKRKKTIERRVTAKRFAVKKKKTKKRTLPKRHRVKYAKALRIKKIRRKKPKRKIQQGRSRYFLNHDFEFFPELQSLILKSSVTEKKNMIKRLSHLGRIRLAVISGIFMQSQDGNVSKDPNVSAADLFIVADDINRKKLRSFLKSVEANVGTEIRFTLMEREEFSYRFGMFDRFIRVLLEGPHEKIINRLGI